MQILSSFVPPPSLFPSLSLALSRSLSLSRSFGLFFIHERFVLLFLDRRPFEWKLQKTHIQRVFNSFGIVKWMPLDYVEHFFVCSPHFRIIRLSSALLLSLLNFCVEHKKRDNLVILAVNTKYKNKKNV